MAGSYAHRWGQIIGNLFQDSVRKTLQTVVASHGLYLDRHGDRPARSGQKVTWQDREGNSHDLDYVMERGGSDSVRGLPAAFIETAWRRYTKHSRNKAQEIEGAVLPLAETYSHLRPFRGCILAGVFTRSSLNQLRSRGFAVAYFPYQMVVDAFRVAGIDAAFDEDTPESALRRKVKQFDALRSSQVAEIQRDLLTRSNEPTDKPPLVEFVETLNACLSRSVQHVSVAVLHGSTRQLASAAAAIKYLERYPVGQGSSLAACKFEVQVRYNTGELIHGIFHQREEAIKFLQTFVS